MTTIDFSWDNLEKQEKLLKDSLKFLNVYRVNYVSFFKVVEGILEEWAKKLRCIQTGKQKRQSWVKS